MWNAVLTYVFLFEYFAEGAGLFKVWFEDLSFVDDFINLLDNCCCGAKLSCQDDRSENWSKIISGWSKISEVKIIYSAESWSLINKTNRIMIDDHSRWDVGLLATENHSEGIVVSSRNRIVAFIFLRFIGLTELELGRYTLVRHMQYSLRKWFFLGPKKS